MSLWQLFLFRSLFRANQLLSNWVGDLHQRRQCIPDIGWNIVGARRQGCKPAIFWELHSHCSHKPLITMHEFTGCIEKKMGPSLPEMEGKVEQCCILWNGSLYDQAQWKFQELQGLVRMHCQCAIGATESHGRPSSFSLMPSQLMSCDMKKLLKEYMSMLN